MDYAPETLGPVLKDGYAKAPVRRIAQNQIKV